MEAQEWSHWSGTQLSEDLSGVLSIRTISPTNAPAYPVLAYKKFLRTFSFQLHINPM